MKPSDKTTLQGDTNTARTGQAAHTPTPWIIASQIAGEGIWIESEGDEPEEICKVSAETTGEKEAKANAAFIVRACNSHAALVEALELVDDMWANNGEPTDEHIRRIRAALKLAKGQTK